MHPQQEDYDRQGHEQQHGQRRDPELLGHDLGERRLMTLALGLGADRDDRLVHEAGPPRAPAPRPTSTGSPRSHPSDRITTTRATGERGRRLRAAGTNRRADRLDIGALTATETALSIIGEIIAPRRGRTGARLAETRGRIHDTVPAEPVPDSSAQLRV